LGAPVHLKHTISAQVLDLVEKPGEASNSKQHSEHQDLQMATSESLPLDGGRGFLERLQNYAGHLELLDSPAMHRKLAPQPWGTAVN
jgi:hypothetical protein